MKIDERLLAYKPISVTLNFDWDNTTFDERAQMRWDYIQEQKKKDPNYIGWDFPEYFKSLHGGRAKEVLTTVAYDLLVNTIGQIASVRNDDVYISFGGKGAHDYRVTSIYLDGVLAPARIHRVMACTFIPIPDKLKDKRSKITVNHKNDVSFCNLLSNLEWVSLRRNTIKAVETGKIPSTSFKLTVTLPCPLLGKEYFFLSKRDLIKQGFSHMPAIESIKTGKPYFCGIWTEMSKEDMKDKVRGMSEEDLAIVRDEKYGRIDSLASVGTIVTEGPCKGDKFVIYGDKQFSKYGIDGSSVTAAIKGKLKVVAACTWERMTREEAVDIPIGLTPEQLDHINKTRSKKSK